MKEQLSKRPPRQFTKSNKASGELATAGLKSVQPGTSFRERDHFEFSPRSKHEHMWLDGLYHRVCSRCGGVSPKE